MNVSDVSFKLAAASLEKGLMPDASTVRSEEFINAFLIIAIRSRRRARRWRLRGNGRGIRLRRIVICCGSRSRRRLRGGSGTAIEHCAAAGYVRFDGAADRVQIIRQALQVLAGQLHPQDKIQRGDVLADGAAVGDGVSRSGGEAAEQSAISRLKAARTWKEAMNLAYQTASRHYLAMASIASCC